MEFETAAALHGQVQRVEGVRALAAELVRPLSQLRAVILQASASLDEVAVFLFEDGRLRGPAMFSTLGMRIQNEQSGSSSLSAQPMAIQPVPEGGVAFAAKDVLEARMEAALAELSETQPQPNATLRQGSLALLTRWYYRPKEKRAGEVFFTGDDSNWPVKAMLRGVGRVVASNLAKAMPSARSSLTPAGTLEGSGS